MSEKGLVHVVDDDEAIRDSLSLLLRADGLAVETHESADAFLKRLDGLASGCVITDVQMPGMTGLELLERLHPRAADFPVIVLTGQADVPMAVEALKIGALDLIEKPFESALLLATVRRALAQHADGRAREGARTEIARRFQNLSPRQREVLDGVVAGGSSKEIARALDISPRTVEVYRANIMMKMQASSLSELVRMALQVATTD